MALKNSGSNMLLERKRQDKKKENNTDDVILNNFMANETVNVKRQYIQQKYKSNDVMFVAKNIV